MRKTIQNAQQTLARFLLLLFWRASQESLLEVCVSMLETECLGGREVLKNALVFQLLLALLLVHVHGDGEAFPKRRIADAGHCG